LNKSEEIVIVFRALPDGVPSGIRSERYWFDDRFVASS
jgi:hypothetical protein